MARILAVDVGNSRIKLGLFDAPGLPSEGAAVLPTISRALPACLAFAAVAVDAAIPWNDILDGRAADAADDLCGVVAGVNPAVVERVATQWPPHVHRLVIGNVESLPLVIEIEQPERVGVDRLLNAIAANAIRSAERPAIVVGCGTAMTIDLITHDGHFAGGAILPGPLLAARSLHEGTALLPELSLEELSAEPPVPPGRSTQAAIRAGIVWGQVGAVRELAARMKKGDGSLFRANVSPGHGDEPFDMIVTGGAAPLIVPHLGPVRWEPHLVLQGLALTALHLLGADA
ncbi:MAG: type III pantothenate kinase [Planctomycetes bacterium]|nr:type III pantothenate kinase [Planctomycetota bacterium]